jgi:predicted transcriptional regulator
MEKKITKREMFNLIANTCKDNNEIVAFCMHEIELLDNKKASGNKKASETTDKNVELVFTKLEEMGRPCTITELIANGGLESLKNESGLVTTQRISAYLKKLVDNGRVVKTTDKKKTLFAIAD